jgi:hypothetical protein
MERQSRAMEQNCKLQIRAADFAAERCPIRNKPFSWILTFFQSGKLVAQRETAILTRTPKLDECFA